MKLFYKMKHTETDELTDRLYKQKAPLVVRYQEMTMKAQKLEIERDALRSLADELYAAIRINKNRPTMKSSTETPTKKMKTTEPTREDLERMIAKLTKELGKALEEVARLHQELDRRPE